MTRLSKENLADRGRFKFNQEELDLPELGGSVVVRSPSVGQRDELARSTPDDPGDWTLEHTAKLFCVMVVEPAITEEEAVKFLGDWPATALDAISRKFRDLVGTKEDMRQAAGDFQRSE